MSTTIWEFTALDTLFFKEARPMESVGGSELQSAFPPPARTLIGAVRSAIGESLDTDWALYARDPHHPLRARIGSPESIAPLSFRGPWLTRAGQRLHAVPLAVLFSEDKTAQTRLRPGSVTQRCDLGRVCLPEKSDPALAGAAPLDKAFVTADGLLAFLEGRAIPAAQIVEAKALFSQEERLGIARDNASRVTEDGLLYQTRHIRPHTGAELGLAIGVQGLDDNGLPEHGIARLGAEGRLASWQRKSINSPLTPKRPSSAKGVVLVLQSHALFSGGWLPDGFVPIERDGQRLWQGTLGNITLRIICAVTGKPVREGGWDLVNHCPRPLQSLVPAGSCYFCEVEGELEVACQTLTGLRIGQDTEYGRGELAAGYW